MEKSFVIDGVEYHVTKINRITFDDKGAGFDLEDVVFALYTTNLKNIELLRKMKKGDKIIYTTGENSVGIQEIFLPVYEMKFGVED